jgi:hypothetical protein
MKRSYSERLAGEQLRDRTSLAGRRVLEEIGQRKRFGF